MTHTISHCHLDSEWQPWLGLGDKGPRVTFVLKYYIPHSTATAVLIQSSNKGDT